MADRIKRIECEGESLVLFPERAVFWKRERVLIVADLHLGKSATFQRSGIPVPEGGVSEDLRILSSLLEETEAREILVLGDMLHAASGMTPTLVKRVGAWIARWGKEARLSLVPGNHDRSAGPLPEAWDVNLLGDVHSRGPFAFVHDASQPADGYAVGGHVHPAVRLRDGRSGVRMPCFRFGVRSADLPAFGSFTGTHVIKPQPKDRIFASTGKRVVEIPVPAKRPR